MIFLCAGILGNVIPLGSRADTALTEAQQTELATAHNRWRQRLGIAPLHWSAALADTAQTWADHLKTARDCEPVHSQNQYGENIYWASAQVWSDGRRQRQPVSPTQVVDSWASERANYTYKTNSCASGKECGHYTQVVARRSTKLGCGIAYCPDSSQVWVCNYDPPGNIIGRQPY